MADSIGQHGSYSNDRADDSCRNSDSVGPSQVVEVVLVYIGYTSYVDNVFDTAWQV